MRKEEISLLRNTSGEKEADHDVPLEASGPEAACSLESILCTEELRLRPSRPPDYVKENRALLSELSEKSGAGLETKEHALMAKIAEPLSIVSTNMASPLENSKKGSLL